MIRFLVLMLGASLTLTGQTMMNYIFHLDNGAQILYQTFSQVAMTDTEKAYGTASASGNMIRRTMIDDRGKPWLGFEVHIDRKPGTGPIAFLLSMEPLGGAGFFGQKPAAREIENGDRILMDVLEEPGTGRKIYDTFQVGIGVPMQIMPLPHAVPQIPGLGTQIHLQSPRFMKGLDAFASSEGLVTGARVAIAVPGKGRFIFSTRQEPGFRMEAIADRARLMFIIGADYYDIQCAAPVVEPSGSWYLWVRKDTAPQGQGSEPTLDLSIK